MGDEKKVKAVNVFQMVVFRIGDEEFGVDISQVIEISRMRDITHIPDAPGFIKGVINLRGKVITVIDIAKQFGLNLVDESSKTSRIVIVEIGDQMLGLIVDEVPEVLRMAENDIVPAPETIQTAIKKDYIRGVGKLEDRLIILVDINNILSGQEIDDLAKTVKHE